MQIRVRGGGRNAADSLRNYAARRVRFAVTRFGVTAVAVRFENLHTHALGSAVQCRLDVELNTSQAATTEVFDKGAHGRVRSRTGAGPTQCLAPHRGDSPRRRRGGPGERRVACSAPKGQLAFKYPYVTSSWRSYDDE